MTGARRTVVLLAVLVATLTIAACGSSSGPTTTTTVPSNAFVPVPKALATEVTDVPVSVFNTIGISSPHIQVTALYGANGEPVLDWKVKRVARPTVYYYGAEFCPFCAAERWPFIIALSRFGTFTNLGETHSSSVDEYANTQTFTFWKASYTSAYINFFSTESYTNIPSGDWYSVLQTPTATETKEVETYDSPNFISGLPKGGSIPFITFNNHFFIIGASYDPSDLAGLSRATIAGDLTNTSNKVTQAIVVTANLISASVCNIDAQQPSAVCQSSGVLAADHAMRLKS